MPVVGDKHGPEMVFLHDIGGVELVTVGGLHKSGIDVVGGKIAVVAEHVGKDGETNDAGNEEDHDKGDG